MSGVLIVVSDATPLNILVRIGSVHVLGELYARVFIPPAVAGELSHERTPQVVRDWMAAAPSWLEVRRPAVLHESEARDAGEREAISLALELEAHYILLDDKRGRNAARKLDLNVVGTVGVLELAAKRNLITLETTLDRLRASDFYLDPAIVQAALARVGRRKAPGSSGA